MDPMEKAFIQTFTDLEILVVLGIVFPNVVKIMNLKK